MTDEELRAIIEDIRKFMREDLEYFETNQQVIGMKHLSRVFSIKAGKETEFGGNECTDYNRIVNKHFIKYYRNFFKDRNNKLHDNVVQRKIIIDWQQK